MAEHNLIPWAWESSEEITLAASKSISASMPPGEKPAFVQLSGECPSCHGPLFVVKEFVHLLDLPDLSPNEAGVAPATVSVGVIEVECDCSIVHPGASQGTTGCGRYFALDIGTA